MMPFFKFFIIYFQYIFFANAGHVQHKLIKFNSVGPCRGTNLPHQVFYQIGKCDTESIFIINNTIIVKEDLMDVLKNTYTFTRCRSKENLDSCEEFKKIRDVDFCLAINPDSSLMLSKNYLAVPFEPKLKCPIKKGAYHANNITLNMVPFLFFSLDRWYWKLKSEVFSPKENNRLVSCTYAEFYTVVPKLEN